MYFLFRIQGTKIDFDAFYCRYGPLKANSIEKVHKVRQQDSYGGEARGPVAMHMELRVMAGRKQEAEKKSFRKVGLAFDPIAAALRQMHDDVASEDIPDDFMKLLDEIDDRVKARKTVG